MLTLALTVRAALDRNAALILPLTLFIRISSLQLNSAIGFNMPMTRTIPTRAAVQMADIGDSGVSFETVAREWRYGRRKITPVPLRARVR